MKRILLFLALTLSTYVLSAQCTPDPSVITWGLHPLPSVGLDGLAAVPETPACIGEPYNYTFSVVVPSSFPLLVGGDLGVTSATVASVTGLPAGLTFGMCNPSSCDIPGGTTGCFNITGTPDASNTPGEFEIEITLTVNGTVGPLPQSVNLTFPPDPTFNLFDFPLDPYAIDLRAANECTNSNDNIIDSKISLGDNQPNPFSGTTEITVDVKESDAYTFTVTNLLGKEVIQEQYRFDTGTNTITFDGTTLSAGVYVYSISNENGVISKKMVVGQ